MTSAEIIAKVLKTDKDIIFNLEKRCGERTAKPGILDKVVQENNDLISRSLKTLGLTPEASLQEIVWRLEQRNKQDELELQEMFGQTDFMNPEFGNKLLKTVFHKVNPRQGLFLKKQKAQEFILNQPPVNIIKCLGYSSAEEMLAKEDLMQIYAGLRFGETNDWLVQKFFKQYEALTPSDFEARPIQTAVLDARYTPLAKEFIDKKYHNVSHLKEMGLLFIIPTKFNQPGQLMKVFSLLFHYCYEIQFYADLIGEYAKDASTFANNIISLFRGDVPEPVIDLSSPNWLVVQRYLEKEDQNDLILMVPHVNPESLHWSKAQNDISQLSENFAFWHNLDWVGGFFKDEIGAEVLVTFNLVDIVMMLADKNKGKKYVYHQREALWNKIFVEYFGWEMLQKSIKDNILGGVVKL
jgi:hypothetical protein